MQKISIACMAMLAMLVSGCGTVQMYEGPQRAASEVAHIKTNVGDLALDTVWVGRLDGRELALAYSELEVSPGPRLTQINVKRGFITRSKTVSFDAKAGRTYRVQGEFNSGSAWIVDEASGEIVAGDKR